MPSNYNVACNSALTATMMQLGIKQKVDDVQHKYEKKLTKMGEDFADEIYARQLATVAVAYYAFVSTGQIVINTPIRPIADNLNVTAIPASNTFNVGLSWSF